MKPGSFDETIKKIQVHHKFKIVEVFNRHKIIPREKAQMNIPLCRMIFVPRGRPTLKIDTLKMEHAFQMTKFFTSLPQTNKGRNHL
jgi:hypothetical protein